MAIIMQLYYTGKQQSALAFAREMEKRGIADQIRQTEGCLSYDYFQSLEDPETILLIDVWDRQDALNRHHASPHMTEILGLRDKYSLVVQAKRYQAQEEAPPKADRHFLKP